MSITDFHDADGREIQPYAAAFMVEHDLDRFDGHGIEFMSWNRCMWRLFEEHVCRCDPKPGHFQAHASEYAAWLQLRAAA